MYLTLQYIWKHGRFMHLAQIRCSFAVYRRFNIDCSSFVRIFGAAEA